MALVGFCEEHMDMLEPEAPPPAPSVRRRVPPPPRAQTLSPAEAEAEALLLQEADEQRRAAAADAAAAQAAVVRRIADAVDRCTEGGYAATEDFIRRATHAARKGQTFDERVNAFVNALQ
jgi:hypothetical protein